MRFDGIRIQYSVPASPENGIIRDIQEASSRVAEANFSRGQYLHRIRRASSFIGLQQREDRTNPGLYARRERVLRSLRYTIFVSLPLGESVCVRFRGTAIHSPVFACGIEHRNVRRQFQLAGADLDAHERIVGPGIAESLSVLRR